MKNQILIALLFMSLAGCQSSSTEKQTITIAAAASLSDAMTEIIDLYESKQPAVEISLHVASSGVLSNQIAQGAPIDVFLSASNEHFNALEKEGLIDSNHRVDLLSNNLILITKQASPVNDWKDLSSPQVNRIAIGTPETVPAGAYAKQALLSMNIWEDLEDKLIYGKDVRQVLTYVETGNADAGIVYESDIEVSEHVDLAARINQDNHSLISYPLGVVKGAPKSAEEFYDFLQSDTATKIFKNHGFKRNE